MTVNQLLSETIAAAEVRERTEFDRVRELPERPVVLFGAGSLGRKVLAALRHGDVKPLGFADNDPVLHGTVIDGLYVYSPTDAAKRWGKKALFIVAIFHPAGDRGSVSRWRQLSRLGCRYVISFLPVGWKYPGVLPHYGACLPSQLLLRKVELNKVNSFLGDDESREIFRQQLSWRLRGSFAEVQAPTADQYFLRELIKPNPQEVFIDGGAFDGDTLRQMPWSFSHALAFEPDPANFDRLRHSINERTEAHQAVLGNMKGCVTFDALGTMASARSDRGGIEVPVRQLDELHFRHPPTFLKLDVEGDELAALEGGRRMLAEAKPIAAICVYHRPEDLWSIPLFLNEVIPTNLMYLRSHASDGFELVVYSIPYDRCHR